jgi:hypothetical protein
VDSLFLYGHPLAALASALTTEIALFVIFS